MAADLAQDPSTVAEIKFTFFYCMFRYTSFEFLTYGSACKQVWFVLTSVCKITLC